MVQVRSNQTLDVRRALPFVPENRNLRQGARGEDVRILQENLRAQGLPIAVDGIFGPQTAGAVRSFQRSAGIAVDGIVGPQTRAALAEAPLQDGFVRGGTGGRAPTEAERAERTPGTRRAGELARDNPARVRGAARTIGGVPVTHPPAGASVEAQFRHYERIVQAAGGQIRPGERHVLALRGLDLDGTVRSTTANGRMQDSIVVLSRDNQGRPSVERLRGSTYPGQRASSASPDVTGDGRGDVGMIAEGRFRAHPNGRYRGEHSWHVRTEGGSGRIPGVRDTNQDGVHSPDEWAASRRRNDRLTEILFHVGAGGDRVSSIGCLNVERYDDFVRALGGRNATFDVTLLNAHGPEPR